jgi:two-component system sensor histidine kinase DesK
MLRHSKVRNCRIEAHERGGRVSLRIVNDGLDAGARTAGRWSEGSGSGISNLSSRVREVGGRLTAGVREDGRFQLAVEIPRDGSDRR